MVALKTNSSPPSMLHNRVSAWLASRGEGGEGSMEGQRWHIKHMTSVEVRENKTYNLIEANKYS